MILVCGEALVDVLVARRSGAALPEANFGGASFNVAVGLARLEVPVAFYGGLSSDPIGSAIVDRLESEGVATDLVHRSDAPSMLALAGIAADGSASYTFPIGNGADKQLLHPDLARASAATIGCATFGSYLAVHPETAPVLLELAGMLRSRSLICFDPNIRLALYPDPATWRRGVETFLPIADFVKASDEDVFRLYGNDISLGAVADAWLKQGAALVVITRGRRGAVLFSRRLPPLEIAAPDIAVVDTVGAGDAFLAGFLAFLFHSGSLEREEFIDPEEPRLRDAMAFAGCVAAKTCERTGADIPRLHEIPRTLVPAGAPSTSPLSHPRWL